MMRPDVGLIFFRDPRGGGDAWRRFNRDKRRHFTRRAGGSAQHAI